MNALYFVIVFVAMIVGFDAAKAQLRIDDRIAIGDIDIKYDANRWRMTSSAPASVQFSCQQKGCDADVRIVAEARNGVCTKSTIVSLALERIREAAGQRFYEPEFIGARRYMKMDVLLVYAYSGCHVGKSDFVFACGEYRGKTYAAWIVPGGCSSGNSEALLTNILSGMITR